MNVIIDRNSCLNRIERIKEKMKIVFKRPSRTIGCFEYVLKCDPEVRKEIRLNEDKISLSFGTHDVVDNYHVTICYHCQRHGHIANSCPDKEKDKTCPNCAENHGIKDCEVLGNQRKCFTCVEAKSDEKNKENKWIRSLDICHRANTHSCQLFVAEIERIKANTDHGY